MPKSVSYQQNTTEKHGNLVGFNFIIRSAGMHHCVLAIEVGGTGGLLPRLRHSVWSSTLYLLLMEKLVLHLYQMLQLK